MKTYLAFLVLLLSRLNSLAQIDEGYPYDDQGIWNEFHAENIGKVVFSSEKIVHNNPDERLVKNVFDLTQPIKGRLYLRRSLANRCYELEKSGTYKKGTFDYASYPFLILICDIAVDGVSKELLALEQLDLTRNQEWTTWWYSFIPEIQGPWNDFSSNTTEWAFGQLIESLQAGNHTVTVSFYLNAPDRWSSERILIADGSFQLSFSEDQKKVWQQKHGYVQPEEGESVYDEPEETSLSSDSGVSNANSTSTATSYIEFKITNDTGKEFLYCYEDGQNYLNAGGVKSFTCTEGQVFKRRAGSGCGEIWFKVKADMNGKSYKVSELN